MATRTVLLLATVLAAGVVAAVPAGASRIAYTVLATHSHVAVMNGDGRAKTLLTSGAVDDVSPAWSPAGTRVAFVRRRRDGSDDLYLVKADGSGLTRLTRTTAAESNPAWSPIGGRLAFEFGGVIGSSELGVVDSDGTDRKRLTSNSVDDVAPVWSPNAAWIAFTRWIGGSNPEIYVMREDGTSTRRLTFSPAEDQHPDWSARGLIAFVRSRAGRSRLIVMKPDGSDKRAIVSSGRPLGPPIWSPDGRRIAFELWDGNDGELYMVSANGSGLTRLTRNDVDDYGPIWSPDGGRIAYTHIGNGNDIWTMRPDGTGKRALARSSRNEAAGDWAR